MSHDDYPLQAVSGRYHYPPVRAWALDMAVQDADALSKDTDKPSYVIDLRVPDQDGVRGCKVAYSTTDGHANWIPAGSRRGAQA